MIRASFRLPPDLIERIDALKPNYSTRAHEATRAEVLRVLLDEALDYTEAQVREKPGAFLGGPKRAAAMRRPVKRSR